MFTDKVSIVTGGSKGIGRAIAESFSEQNSHVIVADKTKADKGVFIKCDVSRRRDVGSAIKNTIKRFGKIDFLINNAGIRHVKPLIEIKESEWDTLIDTNLKGAFLFSKEVLPYMIKQKSGVIVNISSINGLYGEVNLSAYSASKFGLIGLTESLAKEVAKYGIKVFAICPYPTNTETHRKLYPQHDVKTLLDPSKVANKVIELCKPNRIASGSSVIVKKNILDF